MKTIKKIILADYPEIDSATRREEIKAKAFWERQAFLLRKFENAKKELLQWENDYNQARSDFESSYIPLLAKHGLLDTSLTNNADHKVEIRLSDDKTEVHITIENIVEAIKGAENENDKNN